MNIRKANKFDVNYFIHVAEKVHDMDFYNTDKTKDYKHVNVLFNTILNGNGIALIAESDEPIGIVAGIINQNIWYPDMFYMTQILLFVDDDWRHTKVGYKLIKEYNLEVNKLLEQKVIDTSVIHAAEPLHDIDFSRFGYKMAEKIWQLEQ